VSKLAFVLLSCALALSTACAQGAGRRVAILHGDPELQRALALMLAAWDVESLSLNARLSGELDAEARAQAAELARSLHLEGIVWVSPTLQGSRLGVFDAHTGELTLRDLPERPPFTSATAASLALSVKTALRPSVEHSSDQPPPSPPASSPQLQKSEHTVREPPGPRERPVPSLSSARFSLRALLGVGWVAENKVEARWGMATTLWLGPRRNLGAALRLSAGTGVDVDTPQLTGRYRDLALGLGGEWRWLNAGAVSSAFGVGAALRAATLQGTLSDGSNIAVVRYNPGVDASFRLDVRVAGRWFVGLDVSTCLFVSHQRFLVEGRPVFAPFRLSPSLGASLGIALF
jgi:hypothetical protein